MLHLITKEINVLTGFEILVLKWEKESASWKLLPMSFGTFWRGVLHGSHDGEAYLGLVCFFVNCNKKERTYYQSRLPFLV